MSSQLLTQPDAQTVTRASGRYRIARTQRIFVRVAMKGGVLPQRKQQTACEHCGKLRTFPADARFGDFICHRCRAVARKNEISRLKDLARETEIARKNEITVRDRRGVVLGMPCWDGEPRPADFKTVRIRIPVLTPNERLFLSDSGYEYELHGWTYPLVSMIDHTGDGTYQIHAWHRLYDTKKRRRSAKDSTENKQRQRTEQEAGRKAQEHERFVRDLERYLVAHKFDAEKRFALLTVLCYAKYHSRGDTAIFTRGIAEKAGLNRRSFDKTLCDVRAAMRALGYETLSAPPSAIARELLTEQAEAA